jgi:hypothetical protein
MDAGGAANIAPVAALFPRNDRRVYCSEASSRYFAAAGVEETTTWRNGVSVDAVLSDWHPDAVLCGTTRYLSLDREIVPAARAKGIFTVAVLDEWSRYAARFRRADRDLEFLPDAVCVPDELAVNEAAADGLPKGNLVITGSPALARVWELVERYRESDPERPAILADAPRPWIVFISETHATDFGSTTGTSGPLGAFLGYTEKSVAADLIAALNATGRPCTVIEKLHPSDPGLAKVVSLGPGQQWRTVTNCDLHPLLWHADVVVGMRSMALLESAIVGVPTLSYEPGEQPCPPATSARLGLVARAKNARELRDWIDAQWAATPRRRVPRPAFAPPDAAERVRQVVHRS